MALMCFLSSKIMYLNVRNTESHENKQLSEKEITKTQPGKTERLVK